MDKLRQKELSFDEVFSDADFLADESVLGKQDYFKLFEDFVVPTYEVPMTADFRYPGTRVCDNDDAQPYIEPSRDLDRAAIKWLGDIMNGTYDDDVFKIVTEEYDFSRVKVDTVYATSSYVGVVVEEAKRVKFVNNLPSWLRNKSIQEDFKVSDIKKGLTEIALKDVTVADVSVPLPLADLLLEPPATPTNYELLTPDETKRGIELVHMGHAYAVAIMPHVPGMTAPHVPFETRYTDRFYVVSVRTRKGPQARFLDRAAAVKYMVSGSDADTLVTVQKNQFSFGVVQPDFYDYYANYYNFKDSVRILGKDQQKFIDYILRSVPDSINMYFQKGHEAISIAHFIPLVISSRFQKFYPLEFGHYFGTDCPVPNKLTLLDGRLYAGRKHIVFGNRFLYRILLTVEDCKICCEKHALYHRTIKFRDKFPLSRDCNKRHTTTRSFSRVVICECVMDKFLYCADKPFLDECVPEIFESFSNLDFDESLIDFNV